MTPEIEKALATPHAQRLILKGMELHQDELAKLAKKNRERGYEEAASQVSRIEAGASDISITLLSRIAAALRLPLATLLPKGASRAR